MKAFVVSLSPAPPAPLTPASELNGEVEVPLPAPAALFTYQTRLLTVIDTVPVSVSVASALLRKV
jgi:hypothetical protein